jgi:hypothetical protein
MDRNMETQETQEEDSKRDRNNGNDMKSRETTKKTWGLRRGTKHEITKINKTK